MFIDSSIMCIQMCLASHYFEVFNFLKGSITLLDLYLTTNQNIKMYISDLGVFHFVVLIQHGPTQIYSTKVRCTYDELSRNYLTFKDKITL